MTTLTVEEARRLFRYDPETGVLTWRVRVPRSRGPVGAEAGHITSHGYKHIRVRRRRYYAHRVAWLIYYGRWPADQIDHINGDGVDNRIDNLREATQRQNMQNVAGSKTRYGRPTSSAHKGVHWNKELRRWRVQIRVGGVNQCLGHFDDELEAARAYADAARELHGEFANVGRIGRVRAC